MAPTAAAATRVASHLDAGSRGTRGATPTRDAACCSGSGPGPWPGRAQVFFPPRICSTRDPCGGRLQSGGFTHLEIGKLPGTARLVAPRAVLDSARYRAEKEAQQQQQRRLQQQGAAAAQDADADDDEEGTCPVDCVREVRSAADFHQVLADSKRGKALVVVDFYRTACGSCKYIERGFVKLCKGSGNDNASVVFLKHNVSACLPAWVGGRGRPPTQ